MVVLLPSLKLTIFKYPFACAWDFFRIDVFVPLIRTYFESLMAMSLTISLIQYFSLLRLFSILFDDFTKKFMRPISYMSGQQWSVTLLPHRGAQSLPCKYDLFSPKR